MDAAYLMTNALIPNADRLGGWEKSYARIVIGEAGEGTRW
jgi:hypothetical protein